MTRIEPSFPRKGLYIALVGPDGSGKSTQEKLINERTQNEFPQIQKLLTREPGGTDVAEEIRHVLFNKDRPNGLDVVTQLYLFASARSHSLPSIVKPVLDKGGLVVTDRCFLDSMAYQGAGGKLDEEVVYAHNRLAVTSFWPNNVFLLDVSYEDTVKRKKIADDQNFLDRQTRDYHNRVRCSFLNLQEIYKDFFHFIDATDSVSAVHEQIWSKLKSEIEKSIANGRLSVLQ